MAERLRFRRRLRADSTDAERRLWFHLRDRRLGGFKLRRQHSCGPFILDFCCIEHRIAVEVDGGQHFLAAGRERDDRRTRYLESHGLTVLRFPSDKVLTETEAVLEVILDALRARSRSP